MTSTPDTIEFTTAAARRGGGIISFTVHGIEWDQETDETTPISAELKVSPHLDIARFTAAFGALIAMLSKMPKQADLQRQADEGELDTDFADVMERLDSALPPALDALRSCLIPSCREAFDRVRGSIDVMTLSSIISTVTHKLSPVDPTERPSSSDGSAGTGDASALSAPTPESTPLPSPSIEPSTTTTG